MRLSRKDFERFADAIREARMLNDYARYTSKQTQAVTRALDSVANEIADVLQSSNASFDRERFLKSTHNA